MLSTKGSAQKMWVKFEMTLKSLDQIKLQKHLYINIIAAVSLNGFIGKDGKLPWNIPSDLNFFRDQTSNSFVIMGRKTYESIGRPLPGRVNIVITKSYETYLAPGCIVVKDCESALSSCLVGSRVFICGGGNIYNRFISIADELIITHVNVNIEGDTAFPKIDNTKWKSWRNNLIKVIGEPEQERVYYLRTDDC